MRVWGLSSLLAVFGAAFLSGGLGAQELAEIALPPMGWSSWNSFSNTVNSANTVAQADAIHSSGLQKAGYIYVNIDEGWWLGDRDEHGRIIVDPKAWPAIRPGERDGDMSNIVRYIHSLGLKAGIYTDAGKDGCSMYPDIGPAYFHTGSEGYYEQDFLQFAQWGFDYVKVDWCGGDRENLDPGFQYGEIARAIDLAEKKTGHRLYFSICEWGKQSPFTWGPGVGESAQAIWRTGDDIVAPVVAGGPHNERRASFEAMLRNFDKNFHPEAEHTGYYNDPDMMVLGMPGMDSTQNKLHLALWAIAAGPLLIGADVTRLDQGTLANFMNSDVILIDQDAAGLQGVKVSENAPGLEIWCKFLSRSGERAVLLLNRTYFPAPMHLDWSDLGLEGDKADVKDVWKGQHAPTLNGPYEATVPPHDGVLLLVHGTEGPMVRYTPATTNVPSADVEAVFTGIARTSALWSQIKIDYLNSSGSAKIVQLHVNGQAGTRLALPPTGGTTRSVWVQAQLDRKDSTNELTFSDMESVKIQSVRVH